MYRTKKITKLFTLGQLMDSSKRKTLEGNIVTIEGNLNDNRSHDWTFSVKILQDDETLNISVEHMLEVISVEMYRTDLI